MRIFRCSSPLLCGIIAFVCFLKTNTITTKGDCRRMPLIITLVFFGVLFGLEACEEIAKKAYGERALRRYEHVEHPRKMRSDGYLDFLG